MAPLSFGDVEYWDKRFESEETFEWLLDFETLEPLLRDAITPHSAAGRAPQLLHIGCGSSTLSTQLKTLVERPKQIHNVDYSSVAVEKGCRREKDVLNESSAKAEEVEQTRWSTLDLLSVDQVLSFSTFRDGNGRYNVILDKSTSDAISCASDVEVSLPYNIRIPDSEHNASSSGIEQIRYPVHPLYVLGVHLAYLAAPGCQWLVLSYSNDRFTFWDREAEFQMGVDLPRGFSHPGLLWRLAKHIEIAKPTQPSEMPSTVYRPPEVHHLYVLERTEVELNIK